MAGTAGGGVGAKRIPVQATEAEHAAGGLVAETLHLVRVAIGEEARTHRISDGDTKLLRIEDLVRREPQARNLPIVDTHDDDGPTLPVGTGFDRDLLHPSAHVPERAHGVFGKGRRGDRDEEDQKNYASHRQNPIPTATPKSGEASERPARASTSHTVLRLAGPRTTRSALRRDGAPR